MLKHVLVYDSLSRPGQSVVVESTDSARNWVDTWPDVKFERMEYEPYAWPGGYEIHYYTDDGGILCHQCANAELLRTLDPDDPQFHIVEEDVNWEIQDLFCDHCGRQILPEYNMEEPK